ncbi:MAG: aminotransferase class IV [Spirochaetes bacterium]|nr:aminotransferase class IV [Spirochaetota bacterium]
MKFIESIRLENGILPRLDLHQRRVNLTLLAHYGKAAAIDLTRELMHRSLPAAGLFKIRVTYDRKITGIDIDPYVRRAVARVELVDAAALDYRYKYGDRAALDALREKVSIAVQPVLTRDGFVTDALYANVCLFDGKAWVTPEKPLLEGTARAAALAAGEVIAAPVRSEDFRKRKYSRIRFINCMTYFEEAGDIPLEV